MKETHSRTLPPVLFKQNLQSTAYSEAFVATNATASKVVCNLIFISPNRSLLLYIGFNPDDICIPLLSATL